MNINHSPNVEMPSPFQGEEKIQGGVMDRVESLRTAYARGVKEYASIFVDPKNFNDLEELFEAVKELKKLWKGEKNKYGRKRFIQTSKHR